MRPVTFNWPAPDDDGICAAQTLGGAGALTIDGALLDLAATTYGVRRVVLPGIQRTVSLTSTGNLSGVNLTIVGVDLKGAAVSETRAGPNNNTVETTAEYAKVTSITSNGAIATAIKVGTGTTGRTNWHVLDGFVAPFALQGSADVSGTINYTGQYTMDDVQTVASPSVTSLTNMGGVTADAVTSLSVPAGAVRGVVNSSTDGTLKLVFQQAGP